MRKYIFLSFTFFLTLVTAKDPKALVLIIASDDKPFYQELQAIWKTYMHLDEEHFKCYFVKATNDIDKPPYVKEDTFWSNTIEQYYLPGLLDKTIIALEALLKEDDYDYVVRANLASFFIFPRLLTYLKTLPTEKCYAGLLHGKKNKNIYSRWICGAGIIMSRDVAEFIISKKNEVLAPKLDGTSNVDDVALGHFCQRYQIKPIRGPAKEVYSLENWQKLCQDSSDYYHVRFKLINSDRSKEIEMQKQLLKQYYNIEL